MAEEQQRDVWAELQAVADDLEAAGGELVSILQQERVEDGRLVSPPKKWAEAVSRLRDIAADAPGGSSPEPRRVLAALRMVWEDVILSVWDEEDVHHDSSFAMTAGTIKAKQAAEIRDALGVPAKSEEA